MHEQHPTVREQILAAAIDAAADHGIARLSMADVARRAGLSRQTLYRHFPSKDVLVAEAVADETVSLVQQVAAVGDVDATPYDRLVASFAAALVAVREHPLLDRLVRTEPESLLPLLTADDGPVLVTVRAIVTGVLDENLAAIDATRRHRLADMVTRLLVSYAISPPEETAETLAAGLADLLVNGIATEVTS